MKAKAIHYKEVTRKRPCDWVDRVKNLKCKNCPAYNCRDYMSLDETIKFFNKHGIKFIIK